MKKLFIYQYILVGLFLLGSLNATLDLTRADCSCVVTPSDGLAQINNAYSVQHGNTVNASVWFSVGNTTYLAIGGAASGGVTTRLYRFDPNTQQLSAITSGTSGFSLQHGGTINTLAVTTIDNVVYLATAGNASGGITSRLYQFNIYTETFVAIPNAYSVQHGATVRTLEWQTISGVTYLALGGTVSLLIATRLYRLNPLNSTPLTQLTSGTAGFSLQSASQVNSVEWVNGSDGNTYLAVGGVLSGTIRVFLYRFNGVAERLDNITTPLNVQPTGTVNALAAFQVGGVNYLAIGQNLTSGVTLRFYYLDTVTPRLIQINGAFDFQQGGNVLALNYANVCGVSYIAAAGAISSGISLRLYRFNSASTQFSSVRIAPSIQHAAQVNTLASQAIGSDSYLALGGALISSTVTRLYKYNTIFDPYCPNADLSLTLTVDNNVPTTNSTINYTITVRNNGPNNATAVNVVDILPSSLGFISSTPTQGSYSSVSGLWSVGTLNVGASATLIIQAKVFATAGTTITNIATIGDAYLFDIYSGSNSASVSVRVVLRDPAVTISVDNSSPAPGDVITYTINVINSSINAISFLTLNELIPNNVTYISSTVTQGSYNPSSGVWDIGTLVGSTTATMTLTVQVNCDAGGVSITNSVTVPDPYNIELYAGILSAQSIIRVQNQYVRARDAVTQVSNAFNIQPGDLVDVIRFFLVNGLYYSACGGATVIEGANDVSTRLYNFNTNAETFTQAYGLIDGLSVQHDSDCLDISLITINDTTYFVMGGNQDSGITTRLYYFDVYANVLREIPNAFDVQHPATVHSTQWYQVGSAVYLATGGIPVDGISQRLYIFNPDAITDGYSATYPLTQVQGGIAGFDVQPQAEIFTQRWETIDGVTYLAIGGAGDVSGGQLQLYVFDQTGPQLRLILDAFNVMPTGLVEEASWMITDTASYLIAVQDYNVGDTILAYRFNPYTSQFTKLNGVFSVQHQQNLIEVQAVAINGINYVFAGGEYDAETVISTYVFRFNPTTEQFTSLVIDPNQQPTSEVIALFVSNVCAKYYMLIAGEMPADGQVNKLFRINIDPYQNF